MMRDQRMRRRLSIVAVAVSALVLLALASSFQMVRNVGSAMEPTLTDRQLVIVDTLVYRLRAPRSGDVVMFYSPLDPNSSLVRRVVGREGDTVRIVAGNVFVNGQPLADDHVASDFRSRDDFGPQVVPTGFYFMLGDHRTDSFDSRQWGFVPRRYIIGKIVAAPVNTGRRPQAG
jgi:signal peptidase I